MHSKAGLKSRYLQPKEEDDLVLHDGHVRVGTGVLKGSASIRILKGRNSINRGQVWLWEIGDSDLPRSHDLKEGEKREISLNHGAVMR